MDDVDLSAWVGRSRRREDVIGLEQASRMAVTLDSEPPAVGDELPPLWHWAFFQDWVPTAALGGDGHAARGEFLPPVGLPNRMWAGSRLVFHRPPRVGERVVCTSTISSVTPKRGRSGALVFVTVCHDHSVDGRLAIREEQDIVYRERTRATAAAEAEHVPQADWAQTVQPSPVLLFRYSAVTFNAHRIHYDYSYVSDVEGYPGLVVHGPLIATRMCGAFLDSHPQARLRRFSFRGRRPLFAPQPFRVAGRRVEPKRAEVWAADDAGVASWGEIEFE